MLRFVGSLCGVFCLFFSGCIQANNRAAQREVVFNRATSDFSTKEFGKCPSGKLKVMHLGEDLWRVEGCGLRANYDANGTCGSTDDCVAELTDGPERIDTLSRPK